MATQTKFNCLSEDLAKGVHDFDSDAFKLVLLNTAPNAATNTVLADLTQIAGGNGYTTGGIAIPNTAVSRSGSKTSFVGDAVTVTAAGGSVGPFRYWAVVNDTAANKPLVAFYDHGSTITLTDGSQWRTRFNSQDTGGLIIDLDNAA